MTAFSPIQWLESEVEYETGMLKEIRLSSAAMDKDRVRLVAKIEELCASERWHLEKLLFLRYVLEEAKKGEEQQ